MQSRCPSCAGIASMPCSQVKRQIHCHLMECGSYYFQLKLIYYALFDLQMYTYNDTDIRIEIIIYVKSDAQINLHQCLISKLKQNISQTHLLAGVSSRNTSGACIVPACFMDNGHGAESAMVIVVMVRLNWVVLTVVMYSADIGSEHQLGPLVLG